MRVTRRQLRKLIIEAIEAGPHGVWRVPRKDRSPRISTGKLTKDRFHGTAPRKQHIAPEVQPMLDIGTPEYDEQAYELSDTLQGHTYGTAKGAVEDEKQSFLLSKIAGSPLREIVDEELEGFKFSKLFDGQAHDGTDYYGMLFLSDVGELMIDVTTSGSGYIQINGFALEADGVWHFTDNAEIPNSFNVPISTVSKALNKVAEMLKLDFPGK